MRACARASSDLNSKVLSACFGAHVSELTRFGASSIPCLHVPSRSAAGMGPDVQLSPGSTRHLCQRAPSLSLLRPTAGQLLAWIFLLCCHLPPCPLHLFWGPLEFRIQMRLLAVAPEALVQSGLMSGLPSQLSALCKSKQVLGSMLFLPPTGRPSNTPSSLHLTSMHKSIFWVYNHTFLPMK